MTGQSSQQRGNTQYSSVATVTSQSGTIRSVPLNIAGQRISIRTDQSETYINALASEVNGLIDSLRQAAPQAGMPQIMALAAIQLADRAVSAEAAAARENLKVERHIERLSGILKSLENNTYQD